MYVTCPTLVRIFFWMGLNLKVHDIKISQQQTSINVSATNEQKTHKIWDKICLCKKNKQLKHTRCEKMTLVDTQTHTNTHTHTHTQRVGLWVAAGRLILPLLEAGDNKLTIFKTSGEQEEVAHGEKERERYRWRDRERGEERVGGRKKERKEKDGSSVCSVRGGGMMRLTQREIAGERMNPVVRALQQAERGRGKHTHAHTHTRTHTHTHTHTTFHISAGCGRSCLEPAASAW